MEYQIQKLSKSFKISVNVIPLASNGMFVPETARLLIKENRLRNLFGNYGWKIEQEGIFAEYFTEKIDEKEIKSNQKKAQAILTKVIDEYLKFAEFFRLYNNAHLESQSLLHQVIPSNQK